MFKKIGNPEIYNKELISKINETEIDLFYIKNKSDFRDKILNNINHDDFILDIGKGMREKFSKIRSKNVETLDVNQLYEKYDKIICLAILEHVYNPFLAVDNLKKMLKKKGIIYGYVPYLNYYHAPNDLKFQDYFRFSKDALTYLFKDFSKVKLFPIRGRISAPFNIMFAGRWKKYLEKTSINIFLDKLSSDEKNIKQCSGFNFIIYK